MLLRMGGEFRKNQPRPGLTKWIGVTIRKDGKLASQFSTRLDPTNAFQSVSPDPEVLVHHQFDQNILQTHRGLNSENFIRGGLRDIGPIQVLDQIPCRTILIQWRIRMLRSRNRDKTEEETDQWQLGKLSEPCLSGDTIRPGGHLGP